MNHSEPVACRVVSEWTGTNDSDGAWKPDNSAVSNMVQTAGYEYDADGNMVESTIYASSSVSYVTQYQYDWRNRLTDSRGPDDVATKTTYDNLGNATLIETYADADHDFVIDSGELRGKAERLYDELGRVYHTSTYEVESGAATDWLESNVWYNARGMVIKTADSSGLFSKGNLGTQY
jgi:YD repeat-containing protein